MTCDDGGRGFWKKIKLAALRVALFIKSLADSARRPSPTPAAATRSQWHPYSHHVARPPSRPVGALFRPSWSPRRLPRAARGRPRRVARRGHYGLIDPRPRTQPCNHRRMYRYTRESTQDSSCRCCCARRWSRDLRDRPAGCGPAGVFIFEKNKIFIFIFFKKTMRVH